MILSLFDRDPEIHSCPICDTELEEGVTYCAECDTELIGLDISKKEEAWYLKYLIPLNLFLFTQVGIYVTSLFFITFFFDLSESGVIVSLTPVLWEMSNIKWMFISMVIAVIAMYLHIKRKKEYLLWSFIPSLIMIIGLSMALYRFELHVTEMFGVGFLFVLLIFMVYLDLLLYLNYPEKVDESDYESLVKEGDINYAIGIYERAITLYNSALALMPKGIEAWNGKGLALLKLRKIDDALYCFEKIIEMDPDNAVAWHNKGTCYAVEGKSVAAIRFFKESVNLDEEYEEAWMSLGVILLKIDRYIDAKKCFEKAIQLDPKNGMAWNLRGKSLYHSGMAEDVDTQEFMPDATDSRTMDENELIPLSSLTRSKPIAKPTRTARRAPEPTLRQMRQGPNREQFYEELQEQYEEGIAPFTPPPTESNQRVRRGTLPTLEDEYLDDEIQHVEDRPEPHYGFEEADEDIGFEMDVEGKSALPTLANDQDDGDELVDELVDVEMEMDAEEMDDEDLEEFEDYTGPDDDGWVDDGMDDEYHDASDDEYVEDTPVIPPVMEPRVSQTRQQTRQVKTTPKPQSRPQPRPQPRAQPQTMRRKVTTIPKDTEEPPMTRKRGPVQYNVDDDLDDISNFEAIPMEENQIHGPQEPEDMDLSSFPEASEMIDQEIEEFMNVPTKEIDGPALDMIEEFVNSAKVEDDDLPLDDPSLTGPDQVELDPPTPEVILTDGNDSSIYLCPECSNVIAGDADDCPHCGVIFMDEVLDVNTEGSIDELQRIEGDAVGGLSADKDMPADDSLNLLTDEELDAMEKSLYTMPEVETDITMVECPICGEALSEGTHECPVCGSEIGMVV